MLAQLVSLSLIFGLSMFVQITLGGVLPGLVGPPNLLLVLSVVALLHLPSLRVLAIAASCAYLLDLYHQSEVAHLIAYLLPMGVIYSLAYRSAREKFSFIRLFASICLATVLYEFVMALFFVKYTSAVWGRLLLHLPAHLIYHCLFGLIVSPMLGVFLELVSYQGLPKRHS